MKSKHRLTLEKYEKYGEGYNPSINYEDKVLKFVGYGRKQTTRSTERMTKLNQHLVMKRNIKMAAETRILLRGASFLPHSFIFTLRNKQFKSVISTRHCRWDPFDRSYGKKETGKFNDYSWWPSSLRYFTYKIEC